MNRTTASLIRKAAKYINVHYRSFKREYKKLNKKEKAKFKEDWKALLRD